MSAGWSISREIDPAKLYSSPARKGVKTLSHKFIIGGADSPMTNFLDDVEQVAPEATLLHANVELHEARLDRNAAFESWRKRLRKGDKLPRGRFFTGKKPEGIFLPTDKFWSFLKEWGIQV